MAPCIFSSKMEKSNIPRSSEIWRINFRLTGYRPTGDSKKADLWPTIFQGNICKDSQARKAQLNNSKMTSHKSCYIAQIAKFPANDKNLIVWRRIAVGTEVQSLTCPFCQHPHSYFLKEIQNSKKEVLIKCHFSFDSRVQFFAHSTESRLGFFIDFPLSDSI
jgi:hypothetical protein